MAIEKDLFRLGHIQDCISKIQELVSLLETYDQFEEKWIEQHAMIRLFEIMGEASNHVSEHIKKQYPEVAWKEMKGMRNFMTHEYFGLQLDTIWETAVNDIPVLKNQIRQIIQEFEKE